MDDIARDVQVGIMRRRNEELMMRHMEMLQECVQKQCDELQEKEARIARLEAQLAAVSATISEWRTERSIILGTMKWIGSRARIILVATASLLALFYDRIVSAVSYLIDLLSDAK